MNIHTILSQVSRPGRYIGKEYNSASKALETDKLSWALVFPDLYEIGMSHQGLQILYHILNKEEHLCADRCFCPDLDTEALLREKEIPLSALESGRPLKMFDLVGITLPHELCYTNILTILKLADIPLKAAERSEKDPLIVGGGACAFNPEPVADFFDAILLGDGEEAVIDISKIMMEAKAYSKSRQETLAMLASVTGVYVPSRFAVSYHHFGTIAAVTAKEDSPGSVQRRILPDLDRTDHLCRPIVPNARIVHDRLGIEVARGCTRGCRFCQAGITYRPVRERSVDQILDLARQGLDNSGFDELALLSLSTGDYSCLSELLPLLMRRYADDFVSVSLPSMRVGTLTQELMDEIKKVRKTGFTLAPEAGSERLRRVINKGITEEDLLAATESAFSLGWNLIKLYFMIGLPTETAEDIEAIADLARKTAAAGKVTGRGRRKINVSIGTFVPKPHTPFQWAQQLDIETSQATIMRLKSLLRDKGIKLKWHDPKQSYLEGVFARGDRRLSTLIIKAWEMGARLDSWSDHFDLARWQQSADECGLDLDFYLRKREKNEILPWHHLQCLVTEEFLRDELDRSLTETYTPDCRYHGCQKCGLCDFKTIKPIVHNNNSQRKAPKKERNELAAHTISRRPQEGKFRYLVTYMRTGAISYLGHLEFLQIIFRALKRAGIRTNYSQGFNPSPKVSFSPALPVGIESLCEYFLVETPAPIKNRNLLAQKLTEVLPEGMAVSRIESFSGRLPQDIVSTYAVTADINLSQTAIEKAAAFLKAEEFIISRERKGKKQSLDIRAIISGLSITDTTNIVISVLTSAGKPGVKVSEALEHILAIEPESLAGWSVRKISWEGF